ncbi:MAG: LapA family protein [Alphaproteobacteria bacterium]|nr:LapA family protein [Alphaproteobacteria bacterium]
MFIIRWILGFVVTVAAAVFAVLNRHDVTVYWNPLGEGVVILPAYLVALGFMAVGFIVGGAVVWLNMGRLRSERRKQKKEIKLLKKQVDVAKSKATVSSSPPVPPQAELLPVLSARTP